MSIATRDLRAPLSSRPQAGPGQRVPDPFQGRLINGRFRVVGRLAVTAMSRVFQGHDELTGSRVAIKVLETRDRRPEMQRKYQLRFFREAEALARLSHPHIVKVIDHGIEQGVPYLVMEFLEGNTLRALLKTVEPSPRTALTMVEHVTRALAEAHAQGIIHRDIKPSNLFVSGELSGARPLRIRLIDFGIAKDLEDKSELTGHNTILGTPWYMAPEQTLGDPVDGRTDIYALGCLLYRLLMGRTPFGDRRGTGVLMAHVSKPPPLFSSLRSDHGLPPVIEWTVRRCLEKDPERRFIDVHELRRALQLCRRALDTPTFSPRIELVDGRVQAVSQVVDLAHHQPKRVGRDESDPAELADAADPLPQGHRRNRTRDVTLQLLHWTAVGFMLGGLAFWISWVIMLS